MHAQTRDPGRRERQVMDIVCGRVTAAEVLEERPGPPTYSADYGAAAPAAHLLQRQSGAGVGGRARRWDAAAQRWYPAANQHLYRHVKQ